MAPAREISSKLWWTVERVGCADAAAGTSSKPTIAWSPGTLNPALCNRFMIPSALKSVAATTAVEGMPAASMALAAISPPPSRLSVASKMRL